MISFPQMEYEKSPMMVICQQHLKQGLLLPQNLLSMLKYSLRANNETIIQQIFTKLQPCARYDVRG